MIKSLSLLLSIEGNPFIIRFKTWTILRLEKDGKRIEGNPFIIRFKTKRFKFYYLLR